MAKVSKQSKESMKGGLSGARWKRLQHHHNRTKHAEGRKGEELGRCEEERRELVMTPTPEELATSVCIRPLSNVRVWLPKFRILLEVIIVILFDLVRVVVTVGCGVARVGQ
jgi:hypothetical protein